ncbi:hypothetical protein CRM22_006116 [Opisthorchis felineus]|uniref:Adenomatous polyposis coli protein n=1 Tax=Opisthorchis felineus TaxID=147828 RepID=A0A4S2LMQ1_OPIFE|nr:hypothetical protein CRM22_006116 [Opisthorchis felineus]
MQSQQPPHPVYFDQNYVTAGLPSQPRFQVCNGRRHLYQNFAPSPPTNGFVRSSSSSHHVNAPACQTNLTRPLNPPVHFKTWSHDSSPQQPTDQLQSNTIRPSGFLRPSHPGHYATVICQQPSTHPRDSGLSSTAIHHNHPVGFTEAPSTTTAHSLHNFSTPHSAHVEVPNTRDPYAQGPHVVCRRNPPPPPPPRSNSWLGRASGDSSHHVPSHITSGPHHPTPTPYTTATTTVTEPCISRGRHVQSYPAPSGAFVEPHRLKGPSGVVGSWPPCSNGCGHGQVLKPADNPASRCRSFMSNDGLLPAITPVTSAVATQSTDCAARTEVTDTLLRLLICHYTTSPSNPSTQRDPAILDRLLRAVCGTNRPLGGGRFMDSEVASLAQGILPHLIRIIYTEVLAVSAEAADEGYGLRTTWQENPTRDANSCVLLKRRANETSDATVKAESSELSMTTSMESRHSDEEDDLDDLGEYDVETVLNVLEDKPSGWATGAELDALPSGTSIEELKSAAMEAISRLVPMCQADSNLCERDLGIIHLLKAIQTYTNAQQARPKQSPGSVDPLSASLPRCPVAEVAALVRLSFYPEHRTAICELGGVHALIALLRAEQSASTELHDCGCVHSCSPNDKPSHDSQASLEHHYHETSLALRRYICMALTNLTFGVAENKALICRRVANLEALLAQLESGNEELKQVSASVLRNLCWRTDSRSKLALRRVNAPRRLTLAAMNAQRDSTLRTTLSALWNLSAHCSHNKRAVCSVDGVFSFLLGTMHCNDLSNRLVIVENSGGILRNVSAVVAGREDYRILLHQNNCYPILIELLRHSPSLTVVVNVCGTLWNLTASPRCPTDDLVLLCRLGVVDLLHQLARSSHELIRNSSTAVLRNLMQPPRQTQQLPTGMGPTSRETSNFEHKYGNDFAQNDTDPSSPSVDSRDDVGDEDESSCNTDQSCRRRLNSRARLRFGLLSVVLEADDADEEAAEETDDGDDEEEDTYEDEGSIYPDQEAMVTDDSSDIGSRRIVPVSIGNVDPQQLVNQAVTDRCAWQQSDTDEEQACVYAEEGTPYPPDSTTASSLELHQQPNKTHRGPSEEFYLDDSDYYASGQQPIELTSYTSSDGLLHVYASEGSPSQLMSVSPSVVSVSPPSEPHKLSDVFNTRATSQRPSDVSDDGPQLPSPPPDVSGLVSPLLTMQLNDFDPDVNGFTLPPPPLQTVQERQIPSVSTAESSAISPIPTPLIFSRGTSSYISSADLGDLPVGVQSSPQSEYSEQPLMHESDFTDEIDTNPDSRDAISRHESGIDGDADEDHEERLAPLTFSNGDGVEEGNEGEEVRLAFAEEGTPQDTRSSSVSESLLAFPSRDCERASGPPLHCAIYGWPDRNSHTVPDTSGHLVDDPDDEDEQGQSHILQQCIASAMPGNASFTLRTDIPSGLKFPSNHSAQIALFPQADDTVQSFAVEDTPFGTSTKTSSASDLFALDGKAEHLPDPSPVSLHQNHNPDTPSKVNKPLPHSEPCSSPGSAGRIGSSSSINGDTSSDLLSEVIQSAMPKAAQSGLSDCCPVPSDGDCLQLYAVESIPGEDDLSESSSMQHMNSSGLNSLSTQPSLHCSSTTSPAMDVVAAVSGMGSSDTGLSAPPAPPRRTTSVLSSQKDPFAPTSPGVTRPQATVAPMPQVQQCPPITTEPAGPMKPDRLVITDGLRGTHRASLTPADKDDASSFSSLLSIESVGLEHSLLQECITSAMPRPKLTGPLRRQQHQPWEPVHTGFSGSNEANLYKLSASAQPDDHTESEPITTEPQILATDHDSPPLGSGLSAPIPKLSSTGACSSLCSLASSVGHKSAPSASTTTAGLVTDQAPLSGRTKRSGALHFLVNGSDDAPHPPQCSIPTTAINDNRRSPGPPVIGLSAESVTNDGALSEATAATTNESTRLVPPSAVLHHSSLPVRESRLPCLKRVQPVSPQVVKERDTTGVNDQVATDHTLSNILAEGTQAILAALQAAADEDHVSSEQMNMSDRTLLSAKSSARGTCVSPGTAVSSNHRIPTASVLPTRLVQPSQLIKPSTVPQIKSDDSKLDPKNSVKPASKIVTPVQVAKQCLKTNDAKAEKQARTVTKQYRPTTTTYSVQSKTPSVQRSGLRLPAKHSIQSRLASTCPPSATGRSLVSSRSTSVSGSQNNLHLPGSKLVAPSQSISAQSIYAALAKQERHTTINNSKLAKPTSAATSKYRYSSSASTIPTSVKNCNPESKGLSTPNGHLSNIHSNSDQLTSNFGYTAASSSPLVSDDNGPKPIRGGRKSLTGRKMTTTNDKVLEKVVIRPNGPASRPSTQVNSSANQTLPDFVGHRVPCTSSHVEPTLTPKSAKSSLTKLPSTTCSGPTNKTGVIRSSSPTSPSKLHTEHRDTEAGMWIVRGELTMVERAS